MPRSVSVNDDTCAQALLAGNSKAPTTAAKQTPLDRTANCAPVSMVRLISSSPSLHDERRRSFPYSACRWRRAPSSDHRAPRTEPEAKRRHHAVMDPPGTELQNDS